MNDINAEAYCKDCERSIYGRRYKDCDVNNEGLYTNGNCACYCRFINGKRAEKFPCYCKIVDGKRAEKFPWEDNDD